MKAQTQAKAEKANAQVAKAAKANVEAAHRWVMKKIVLGKEAAAGVNVKVEMPRVSKTSVGDTPPMTRSRDHLSLERKASVVSGGLSAGEPAHPTKSSSFSDEEFDEIGPATGDGLPDDLYEEMPAEQEQAKPKPQNAVGGQGDKKRTALDDSVSTKSESHDKLSTNASMNAQSMPNGGSELDADKNVPPVVEADKVSQASNGVGSSGRRNSAGPPVQPSLDKLKSISSMGSLSSTKVRTFCLTASYCSKHASSTDSLLMTFRL